MKVIEKGKGSETDKSARFICKKCGAVIEAKRSEGKFIPDQRDGDCYRMKCPQCNSMNYVAHELFQL